MKLLPLTVLALGLALAAAAAFGLGSSALSTRTYTGPAVAVGEGEAWSFVRTDADGAPESIGIVFTESALEGLPHTMPMPGQEDLHMRTLALPAEAASLGLPFDHLSFDWNPSGHEPDGLFTVPHFDFHFYMVPEAERRTWVLDNPEFMPKGLIQPDPRYLPPGYVSPPDNLPIPFMGLHWVDSADPTYAPGGPPFTEVMIWGSYDGRVVFPEPMVTLEYLRSRPQHTEPIALPEAFERAGAYPTRYTIRYDRDLRQYTVALEGLEHRPAS